MLGMQGLGAICDHDGSSVGRRRSVRLVRSETIQRSDDTGLAKVNARCMKCSSADIENPNKCKCCEEV
jgi:hypothetical protein